MKGVDAMPQEDIARQLLRGQRRQTGAVVIIAVVLVLLSLYVLRQESQTHMALCSLQTDLAQRVQSETDFLAKHPHGIPGISVANIQTSISGQERTIKALAVLHC